MSGVNRYTMVAALMEVAKEHGWTWHQCESKEGEIKITLITDEEEGVV